MKLMLSLLFCSLSLQLVYAQSTLPQPAGVFHIAGTGGWDYLSVNGNRLYVSHGTQVNVVDKVTGDSVGVIANTAGVHGIGFVPSLNRGYTSNGRLNNVYVFDLTSLQVLDSIQTGQNPDAIFYDVYAKRIVTCNGRSQNLTFIDPTTNKVTATVAVGGKPETAVSDEAGKLYVNIEDKNEIAVIDTKTFTVTAHWSILPGEAPTGLVIDTKTKRLFAACGDNAFLMVLDAQSGKVIEKLPIGKGCDGAAYDPELNNIYTSNGADGTMSVIHADGNDKFSVVATVPTKRSARTIAVDPGSHKIYLPAADTEAATGQGRPRVIPGTFQVLVYNGKQ